MTNRLPNPIRQLIARKLSEADTVFMTNTEADRLAAEVVPELIAYLRGMVSGYAAIARESGCVQSIRDAGDPELAKAVGEHYEKLLLRLADDLTTNPMQAAPPPPRGTTLTEWKNLPCPKGGTHDGDFDTLMTQIRCDKCHEPAPKKRSA